MITKHNIPEMEPQHEEGVVARAEVDGTAVTEEEQLRGRHQLETFGHSSTSIPNPRNQTPNLPPAGPRNPAQAKVQLLTDRISKTREEKENLTARQAQPENEEEERKMQLLKDKIERIQELEDLEEQTKREILDAALRGGGDGG
ncbi:hypothetical protein G7Y89_g4567 [Cudoniella acicularis]|uniref:Uncharacterized protein n=1 Tax=Cudoniella acicularis TaxID=354080 RepID=A0A8H4W464_9HELO|nr:hypothetical protein G7Y89_g4567 [Cudoniella acicularis]